MKLRTFGLPQWEPRPLQTPPPGFNRLHFAPSLGLLLLQQHLHRLQPVLVPPAARDQGWGAGETGRRPAHPPLHRKPAFRPFASASGERWCDAQRAPMHITLWVGGRKGRGQGCSWGGLFFSSTKRFEAIAGHQPTAAFRSHSSTVHKMGVVSGEGVRQKADHTRDLPGRLSQGQVGKHKPGGHLSDCGVSGRNWAECHTIHQHFEIGRQSIEGKGNYHTARAAQMKIAKNRTFFAEEKPLERSSEALGWFYFVSVLGLLGPGTEIGRFDSARRASISHSRRCHVRRASL